MSESIVVRGVPYQIDAEAEAGITLNGPAERWWGTRIKWRAGISGKWNHVLVVDLHPLDSAGVEKAAREWIERQTA